MRTALGVLLVACLSSGTAHAGRSFFGWMQGTEVMPERGAELQTWVIEENQKYASNIRQTSLWVGPVIGITDQLELLLPIELDWVASDVDRTIFTFRRFGIGARYRFVSQDPVDAPPLVPLVQVSVKRDVTKRDDVHVEAGGALSYETGAVLGLVELGFVGDLMPSNSHTELRPAGGLSVAVTSELRVGAEIYSELSLDSRGESWAAVGPNLSWTHGRFWASGAFGIGIYHIETAPRVMWGLAF